MFHLFRKEFKKIQGEKSWTRPVQSFTLVYVVVNVRILTENRNCKKYKKRFSEVRFRSRPKKSNLTKDDRNTRIYFNRIRNCYFTGSKLLQKTTTRVKSYSNKTAKIRTVLKQESAVSDALRQNDRSLMPSIQTFLVL